jgi:hypothetical protein
VTDDSGGALVEFIAITLLLLIPVVYLVVTVSRIQAGTLAAEAAAHDAARAAVVQGVRSLEQGESHARALEAASARAHIVVGVNASNFGFSTEETALALGCSAEPCLSVGSNVTASVDIVVTLPGVPGFLGEHIPLAVTVSATSRAPVDGLAGES